MIKILHTSDWHIGANFSNFPKNKISQCIELQFLAIENMIKTAISENVNIILMSGDMFDTHNTDFLERQRLFNIISSFHGKIFLSCGNHDYYFQKCFWDNFSTPKNLIIFKSNQFREYVINPEVSIFGASFTDTYETIDIENIALDTNKINIGVVHSDILTKSSYNHYTKEQISNSKLSYLACGHNHSYSGIQKSGNTFYASSGNISSTGYDEPTKNGFIIATITKDHSDFSFIESSGLEMYNIEIDVSKHKNNLSLLEEIKKYYNEKAYLKILLLGSINFQIDTEYLLEHTLPNVIFATLEIKTTENLWKYLDDDNLIGEFSRIMKRQYEKSEHKELVLESLKHGILSLLD